MFSTFLKDTQRKEISKKTLLLTCNPLLRRILESSIIDIRQKKPLPRQSTSSAYLLPAGWRGKQSIPFSILCPLTTAPLNQFSLSPAWVDNHCLTSVPRLSSQQCRQISLNHHQNWGKYFIFFPYILLWLKISEVPRKWQRF